MALVHESMVLCSERTWGPCLARPGHCKFVLDAEGISLPSDGPGCVACDSHPPPAWLPGTVSVTSTFRRGLGACRAMRLTAWQVYTAHVMGTPRPERRRAGDPDLYLWRKSLSSLSQGAFNQRLAALGGEGENQAAQSPCLLCPRPTRAVQEEVGGAGPVRESVGAQVPRTGRGSDA